jgi:DNA-binding HxlR family transcriptional regulator
LADWQKVLFDLADTKVLLFIHQNKTARYYELLKIVVKSRSTLAASLRDLQSSGLIIRKVRDTHPLTTEYSLTDKGKKLVQKLLEIREILES